jgi:hypothetical protein
VNRPAAVIALGYLVVFVVLVLGSKFLWTAYFDPDYPYLPEGSDALVLFVTATMGGCIQWALSTATSVLTGRQAGNAFHQGLYTEPPKPPKA